MIHVQKNELAIFIPGSITSNPKIQARMMKKIGEKKNRRLCFILQGEKGKYLAKVV